MMAKNSTIEWTDATWQIITGCTMVSAGCTNCYAMGLAASRLRNHPSRAGLTRSSGGRAVWTGEVRFNRQWLDQPLRWKRPRKIFVCAHGDLFHEAVPDEWLDKVFAVMALAPRHQFQVLTKRPERARRYLNRAFSVHLWSIAAHGLGISECDDALILDGQARNPLPNVWLGTSVEDQATADTRIPHLLATPAAVRFISAEPLLGPVDLGHMDINGHIAARQLGRIGGYWINALTGKNDDMGRPCPDVPRLDWVIVGGESGPGARPMHPDWARSLRDQCQAAGVAFFFKQWGEWAVSELRPDGSFVPPLPLSHRAGCLVGSDGACFFAPEPGESLDQFLRRTTHWAVPVGKKAAGRTLDGRTHDAFPEAQA